MRLCKFPDCGRPLLSKGLCQTHYWQQRKGKSLCKIKKQRKPFAGKSCSFPDCGRHAICHGLCPGHAIQKRKGKKLYAIGRRLPLRTCTFSGCDRRLARRDPPLCDAHWKQYRRGIKLKPVHIPRWRYITEHGYVLLKDPEDPNASRKGMVMEHVKVMSKKIGRVILPGETVHHKNGIKTDNRPENLELWAQRHGRGQRVSDLLEWAREIIQRYEGTEFDAKTKKKPPKRRAA